MQGGKWVRRTARLNEFQLFAFVILPIVVVALGWLAVFLNQRFGGGSDRKREDLR